MGRAAYRCASLHYLRIISALAFNREVGCGLQMILLAKLDRLAIGTILRSKLVFLVNVRLYVAFIEGARRRDFDLVAIVEPTFCRVCGH